MPLNNARKFSSYFTDIRIVGLIALALSIIATTYSYFHGYILAYGDAESHIDIAKRVINGLQPGFGQLGGIWLPLNHLLMLPFVWNDFLWRSGLAGSFVSMAAYILAVIYVFKLTSELTLSRFGSFAAAAIFGLNPGILYMQSTPMSELPLIAAMVVSIYYLHAWVRYQQLSALILAAIFCTAGTLIRYDAWSLAAAEVMVVVLLGAYKRWRWSRIEGTTILFGTVALSGIVLWIGWSLAIFKQPAYFLASQYSAKSQQQGFAARGELVTAHDFGKSLLFYGDAVWENAGAVFSVVALLGLVIFIVTSVKRRSDRPLILPGLMLLVPFAFNVLTLYLGISILFLPALVPHNFEWQIFNARYGLLMVPTVAIFAAYALSKIKPQPAAAAGLIVALPLMFASQPIALEDGLTGLSARRLLPANSYVAQNYDFGNIVFDDFSRAANPIALNIPIQKIIYVGYGDAYQRAVTHPASIVRWIIVRRADTDAYWTAVKDNPEFKNNYEIAYVNGDSAVYRQRDASQANAGKVQP